MQHVFVYGSLLFPEVVEALTGTTFPTKDGILPDFRRFAISGADYPAIVSSNGSTVKGKILFDVDDHSLEVLKFYEGDEYERISATIHFENETTEALVFVWKGTEERLNGTWSEKHFRDTSLEAYINEVAPETRMEFEALRP